MVRIIGKEKQAKPPEAKAPEKLSQKSCLLMQLIGTIVAENPVSLKELLRDYGVEPGTEPKSEDLIEKLLEVIAENSSQFNHDLASVILDSTLDTAYDNFNLGSLLHGNDAEGDQKGSGGLIGGIAGAIGQVGNAVGSGLKNKQAKDQATNNAIQGALAYKKQVIAAQQAKTRGKNQLLFALLALFGLGLLAAGFYYRKQLSNPTIKS